MFIRKHKKKVIPQSVEQPNQSKAIIHSGKSYYIIDAGIIVEANNRYAETLYSNKTVTIPIIEPTILRFTDFLDFMTHSPAVEVMVMPNAITEIWLKWNKTTIQITKYKRRSKL